MKKSLLLIIYLPAFLLVSANERLALTPVSRNHQTQWAKKHTDINQISASTKAPLIFLGDSITEGWKGAGKNSWENYFSPLGAVNYGIGGDRTEHVLWRIQNGNFKNQSPKLIVLMLGTNNTGHSGIVQAEHQSRVYNSSPRDTTDGLHQIIESLLKEMPSTQILLISILPRGESPTCFARIQNQATNTIIKTFANQKNIHWIDTQDLFLNSEGSVNRDDMPDLLHLSSSAYEKWAQRLIPKIKELLKP